MADTQGVDSASERLVPRRTVARNLAKQFPESTGYRIKNRLLGKPLVTEQLASERMGKPTALGVLAPDCISSSAYGTEQILTQMTPYIGLAAFTLVVPISMAIIGILFFVTLSYFDVIGYYTRIGGSYIVARDNFGPKIAQIASVALLIDYTVTVAVQSSAGTAALTSAVPGLKGATLIITIGVVLVLIYGNLRGIKEAGRIFAFPTYFYVVALASIILIGFWKEFAGTLKVIPIPDHNLLVDHQFGASGTGWLMGLAYIQLLRAFANGGSSLTGLEAISDSVGAFRSPASRNARQTLVAMSTVLGFLVLGTALLASWTHAVPFAQGTPTVVSQEVRAVLGTGALGHVLFLVVQFATVLILYTGGNTAFNGFPFLASFVANDHFLPRQMTKRGHRLAFSNGIIILGAVAIVLIIIYDAQVSRLVALYAVGVFTSFTIAGAGMVKHHLDRRSGRWRWGVIVNGTSGILSFIVVAIFVVAKFREGAWIIVVVAPLMFWGLLRLRRSYAKEEEVLRVESAAVDERASQRRHTVIVFVDSLDMAASRAIAYARTLSRSTRAVHFDIDDKVTKNLVDRWAEVAPKWMPLDVIACPDRRLERASIELVAEIVADPDVECTILLPRRAFNSRLSRVLHDRTADSIVQAVAIVPHVSATIVPFNFYDYERKIGLETEIETDIAAERRAGEDSHRRRDKASLPGDERLRERSVGAVAISDTEWRQRAKVAGRIKSVRVQTGTAASNLECTLADESGTLLLVFQGRPNIPGIEPGARLVVEGMVGSWEHSMAMLNPDYELIAGVSEDEAPAH
jgi:amino acid transporter